MELLQTIFRYPFVWGLLLGLGIAFFLWKSGYATKRRLSRDVRRLENELRDLRNHLNTQLKINSEGHKKLEDELESLRAQNGNLKVSVAALRNKPGRAEMWQYQIVDAAVRHMREQAPGFAPAWEKALREAEEEVESGKSGLRSLVHKAFPGIGMKPASPPGGEAEND